MKERKTSATNDLSACERANGIMLAKKRDAARRKEAESSFSKVRKSSDIYVRFYSTNLEA